MIKLRRVKGVWYASTLNNVPMFAGTLTEVMGQVEQYIG